MDLMTTGEFARATRLSPKALRIYDELGLLRPARVDPRSGYRHYSPDQLEPARLVARLRRVGMPLPTIAAVIALPPREAADAVQRFWRQAEADHAARRELAAVLADHLSGEDTTMPTTVTLRGAARTDRGLVRATDQDAAHADASLVAVADGFGGDGRSASSAAIAALRHLAGAPGTHGVLDALDDALDEAAAAVGELGEDAGTTLTALVPAGSRLVLVHVGDTRAHLLRDGVLVQVTHDHTRVQALVDEGALAPNEAAAHPDRALLLRALHATGAPDVTLREARPGDRYLLSSDGLHAVVPAADVARVLREEPDPAAAVDRLIALALEAGAPDDVACAVADVRVA